MSAIATETPVPLDRLRLARERCGLNLWSAARRAGFAKSTVRNVESGHRAPTPVMMTALAAAYRVPVEWLCGGEWTGDAPEPKRRRVEPKPVEGPKSAPGAFLAPTKPPEAHPVPAKPTPLPSVAPAPPNGEHERDYIERRYLSRPRQADEARLLYYTLDDLRARREGMNTLMGRWFAHTADLPEFTPTPLPALALWLQAERERRLSQ